MFSPARSPLGSPHSSYAPNSPVGTPFPPNTPGSLTPNALAATPIGLSPQAPAGTPTGALTPSQHPDNDRWRFMAAHSLFAALDEALRRRPKEGLPSKRVMQRREAAEKGFDAIEKLFDQENGNEKLDSYKKLEHADLAKELASLFYGCVLSQRPFSGGTEEDDAQAQGDKRFKQVFEMAWLSKEDQLEVRKEALAEIERMDGQGITTETLGDLGCLDPKVRSRLSKAEKLILNKLEHDQWVFYDIKKTDAAGQVHVQETEASSSAVAASQGTPAIHLSRADSP